MDQKMIWLTPYSEAANRQVTEFSLTSLKKTQFGGEPCFDLIDLLGHTYIQKCEHPYVHLLIKSGILIFFSEKSVKMPPKHAACAVSNAIKKALAKTDYKCLGSGI